jgi:hypothetical protein
MQSGPRVGKIKRIISEFPYRNIIDRLKSDISALGKYVSSMNETQKINSYSALRFVSDRSKEQIKSFSSSNSNDDYDEDKDQLEEEQTEEATIKYSKLITGC